MAEIKRTPGLRDATILISVGIFVTTFALTHVVGRLPIQNLLKNELHVGRAENAAFFFWITVPWYFKPVAGLIVDAFPILGSRRKVYLIGSTALSVLGWAALGLAPHRYSVLLWVSVVLNSFTVVTSAVVGAAMVEAAQANAGSGRLSALRNFVQQACFVLNGPIAGFLAGIAFGWTAALCGAVMFMLIPVGLWYLHETPQVIAPREMLGNAAHQLARMAAAKTMWGAIGLMALFYIAPGLWTAVFYIQQNDLHMSTDMQGFLQFLNGVGGIAAAALYAVMCRYIRLRYLLVGCLCFAAITSASYLFYSTVHQVEFVEWLYSFGYTLGELVLIDLALRATPVGSEGLGFGLMISVRNLAIYGTDWMGSALIENYHLPFNWLVLLNSGTTLLAVPLVFLLPRALVNKRDAEIG